jgi:hypothetical protein
MIHITHGLSSFGLTSCVRIFLNYILGIFKDYYITIVKAVDLFLKFSYNL